MANPPVVAALLLIRVAIGVTMVMHGYNHWRGGGKIAGTARWFSGLGLRCGVLQAWMSVVTEMGAGFLLIVGLVTPLACAAVISVMLIAGLLAHRRNGFFVWRWRRWARAGRRWTTPRGSRSPAGRAAASRSALPRRRRLAC